MQQIPNVQTSAGYTAATTLGPDNFEGIYAEVWNSSAVMQLFTEPASGYQLGDWGDELVVAAGSTPQIARCGGIRFKTNPGTPSSPARIIAYAWKDGEPQIASGAQLTGTLGGTGGITGGAVLTGLVDTNGTPLGGTGWTAVHSATGTYDVTYATAFSSPAVVLVEQIGIASSGGAAITHGVTVTSTTGFTVVFTVIGGPDVAVQWMFTATATV